MFLAVPKGIVSRVGLTKLCFCQRNNNYIQNTVVSQWCDYSWSTQKYSVCSVIAATSFIRLPSPVLTKRYEGLTTVMSEHSYSSLSENQQVPEEPKLSNKDKLKRAVKDYGTTVIIFHVSISLISLGISYLIISSGVDVASLLSKIGIDSASDIATGASTFVVAYAFHKVFAPVRISITLGSTPFIVRYLRRVGILKPPKSTGP